MKTVLFLYPSPITHESRINRITQSLLKINDISKIFIVGLCQDNLSENEIIDEVRFIWRVKLRIPLIIPKLKSIIKKTEWYFRIFFRFYRIPITVIHCSSIYDLPLGFLLKLFSGNTKLIYDANELETETHYLSGVEKKINKIIEATLMKHVDSMIVINNSIADWYKSQYKHLKNIHIIRNIPVYNNNETIKSNILKEIFNIPKDHVLVIYQGYLSEPRGVKFILDIFVKAQSNKHIVFMGFGEMENVVKEYAINYNNIHFHKVVQPEKILQYSASADIGTYLLKNICLNHYFILPNKIFEYIASGIPLLVKDFPEMAKIIDKYDCGWKISDNFIVEDLVKFINNLTLEEIQQKKQNTLKARKFFNWNDDEKILIDVYKSLLYCN